MIRPEELQHAETVAAINNPLEQSYRHDLDPDLVGEISRAVARPG